MLFLLFLSTLLTLSLSLSFGSNRHLTEGGGERGREKEADWARHEGALPEGAELVARFGPDEGWIDNHTLENGVDKRATCTGTRTVEMVAFIDCGLQRDLGGCASNLIAAATAQASAAYARGDTNPGFDCKVRLHLLAIFGWGCECSVGNDGMPSSISYNERGDDEVDYIDLHSSFRSWQSSQRSTIESKLGRSYDVAFLVTNRKLEDDVIGYANLDTMCGSAAFIVSLSIALRTQDLAVACLDPAGVSLAGNLIAHEVGHTMGLRHEGTGANCPTFVGSSPSTPIMCSILSSSDEAVFSTYSRGQLNNWFSNKYGSTVSSCLGNAPPSSSWQDLEVCGDGRISGCEECDPGFGVNDPCCNEATCKLVGGCSCASCNHKCCSGAGSVFGAGVQCRATKDASNVCDQRELCDGTSPHCPVDKRGKTGDVCSGSSGRCYTGECRIGWPRVAKASYSWYGAPCDIRSGAELVYCMNYDNGEQVDDSLCSSAGPRPDSVCCPAQFPPTPKPPTSPPPTPPPVFITESTVESNNGTTSVVYYTVTDTPYVAPTSTGETGDGTTGEYTGTPGSETVNVLRNAKNQSPIASAWKSNSGAIVAGIVLVCVGCVLLVVGMTMRRRAARRRAVAASLEREAEAAEQRERLAALAVPTDVSKRRGTADLLEGDRVDSSMAEEDESALDVEAAKAMLLPPGERKAKRRSVGGRKSKRSSVLLVEMPFTCSHCGKSYTDKKLLVAHVGLRHPDAGGADGAGATDDGPDSPAAPPTAGLTPHRPPPSSQRSVPPLSTDEARRAPPTRDPSQAKNVGAFRCATCGNTYETDVLRLAHVKLRHTAASNTGPTPTAPPARSASRIGLAAAPAPSRPLPGETRVYRCTECPEQFPVGDALQAHALEAHGAPELTCVVCGKEYERVEEVNAHLGLRHAASAVAALTKPCERCKEKPIVAVVRAAGAAVGVCADCAIADQAETAETTSTPPPADAASDSDGAEAVVGSDDEDKASSSSS
jgi:hypothetical protein